MTHSGRMTLGIACGAIAGLAIGILMAPASGRQTRQSIRQTTTTWVNRFGKLFTSANGRVEEQIRKTRQRKAAAIQKVNRLKKGLG